MLMQKYNNGGWKKSKLPIQLTAEWIMAIYVDIDMIVVHHKQRWMFVEYCQIYERIIAKVRKLSLSAFGEK